MSITLWQYYVNQARTITENPLKDARTLAQWQSQRVRLKRQFMESHGIADVNPVSLQVPIQATSFGEFKGRGYRARKMAYQLMPDCWGSGTMYYPDPLKESRAPAVLYCCGHQGIGILGYQHHAVMWARRGYVCFIFDTIEQHDNLGTHHGTYYKQRYDWLSLGYSGAGGELYNARRALEVLFASPEVDPERIGVTGISGGGALSFFLAIADERIKAVASACGVALPQYTLGNRHVQNHCDCMYYHNLFRKDPSEYAALIAPRPALFCFTAQDMLYSRGEWRSLVKNAQKVYDLYGLKERCALCEKTGHHAYHPDAITAINNWFDKYVAGRKHAALVPAKPENTEAALTVFNGAPAPANKTYLLPELLSQRGSIPLPASPADWPAIRRRVLASLSKKIHCPLDDLRERLSIKQAGNWLQGPHNPYQAWRGEIGGVDVWIELHGANECHVNSKKAVVVLAGPGETAHAAYDRVSCQTGGHMVVAVEPRGAGMTSVHDGLQWDFLRAGSLIGLTPTTLLIQDLRLIMPFIYKLPLLKGRDVYLYGHDDGGVACLYHTLFDERIAGVVANAIPASHCNGAYILDIVRLLDIDHILGLIAPRPMGIVNQPPSRNMWADRLIQRLKLPCSIVFRGNSVKGAFDSVMSVDTKHKGC